MLNLLSGLWVPFLLRVVGHLLCFQPRYLSVDSTRPKLADLLRSHAGERQQGFFRLPSTRRQEMLGILRDETGKGFWREYSLQDAGSSLRSIGKEVKPLA